MLALLALALVALTAHVAVGQSEDVDTLNFALTLEHLEYAFYRDGLETLRRSSWPGEGKLYRNLVKIRDQEQTHVNALNATITGLGGTPVAECEEYDFGYRNARQFLEIARVLENVGTSAYIGSAYQISDSSLLTTAAAIATVEARHAAYLNDLHDTSPFPHAFDSPLDQQSVLGLASPYMKNCSSGLPVEPHPHLNVSTLSTRRGRNVTVSFDPESGTTNGTTWCIFYAGSYSASDELQWRNTGGNNATRPVYWCTVPENALSGDNFLFISSAATYDVEDPEQIVAGPALIQIRNGTGNDRNLRGGPSDDDD